MSELRVQGLAKAFPAGPVALDGVSLEVGSGEILGVLGPSGAGKSTLLRIIAGLERSDSGSISLAGRPIDGLAPGRRDLAMAFQDAVVYPHLSVRDNLTFSARAAGLPRADIASDLIDIAALLRIERLLDRMPRELSGGERQRVAFGRAILKRPRLFLLDEPFASLDAPLRRELADDIARLCRRRGVTTLLITHDQAEALAICDRIGILDRGRLLQVGRPEELHRAPGSWPVAAFLGTPTINRLEVDFEPGANGTMRAVLAGSTSTVADPVPIAPTRGSFVGIRPDQFRVAEAGSEDAWPLRLESSRFDGSGWLATGTTGGTTPGQFIRVRLPQAPADQPVIYVRPQDPRSLLWFDSATGLRIG